MTLTDWTRMRAKGQITLPKWALAAADIQTGDHVDVQVLNGEIILRKSWRGLGEAKVEEAGA